MRKIILSIAVWTLAVNASAQNIEIFVSDAGNFNLPPWQILKYDENGANPQLFTNSNIAWPQDIVFLEDNTVLVSNLNSGRITKYDATTGIYLGNFATGIGGPTRMKIGADNLLYVLQWQGNGRVRRYQLDGNFVDEFTSVGVAQSIGLDWDSSGNLYVSSFNGALVRKFDSNGNDLGLFISSNLQGPTNIWFDSNGDLLVADFNGGAVKRFNSNGFFLDNFILGVNQAEGVAYLPNGDLLLGNGGTGAVKQFGPGGNFIRDFVPAGSGGLIRPNAVVIRDTTPPFQINAGLNDAWVNTAAARQGMFITVFPDLKLVFVAWFTFDSVIPAGGSAVFGAIDQRWVTGLGSIDGNRVELKMELTSGGSFNTSDPEPVQDSMYGTMVLEFTGCSAAMVTFSFPSANESGQFNIERALDSNIALCESLSE